jgi:hypothetical protein
VVSLAIIVWAKSQPWGLLALSPYEVFPVLGLIAFSLMWGHFFMGSIRALFNIDASSLKRYYTVTSWVVLLAILFHPGLLIYQLWRDGFGLPPGSYLNHYVAESMGWAAMLGFISLMAFLAFELHRFFKEKSWWHWVERASDVAMIAIFVHGLMLGRHTQEGWFRYVWIFYGITLVLAIAYGFYYRYKLSKVGYSQVAEVTETSHTSPR